MSLIWVPATMTSPRRNTQRGIIKNAENVDTAVIVTDKSRLPPNIIVQMLEAPPPGEVPVKKRPSRISGLSKMKPRAKEQRGMNMNWETKPTAGPIGFFSTSLTTFRSRAQPKLM